VRNTIEYRHGIETMDGIMSAGDRNRAPLSEAAAEIALLIVQRAIAERNMARMAEMPGMEAVSNGTIARYR
jgi:hypothetical protein